MKEYIKKFLNKENIVLFFILIFVIIIYFLITKIPSINSSLVNFNRNLIGIMVGYGLIGAFLICLIANASLIFQIPYAPALILLGSQATSIDYLIILSIVAGIGCTLGEIVSYYFGRGIILAIDKEPKSFNFIKKIISKRPRLIPFFVFLVAVSPFPDDIFIIPLGMINYGVKRIILPTFLGKTILSGIATFVSYYSYQLVSKYTAINVFDNSIFLLILVLFLIFVGYKTNKKINFKKNNQAI